MSIDQLDLRLVRYFVAVAEELHFHRAAARLHISQPSLSHQIRQLERQLGVSLLTRNSRSVELTPAGRALLDHGRALLLEASRVLHATRQAGSPTLTVGFYGSAATAVLPEVLRLFEGSQPPTEITLRELLLGDLEPLLSGEVDVAFTRLLAGQAGTGLEVEVLTRQPRLVALPREHPLTARRLLRFADLRDESFITNPAVKGKPPSRWLEEQRRHGLPGRIAAQAASVQELLALVAAGRGVSLVPAPVARQYRRSGVRFRPIADAEPAVVSIACQRGDRRPIVEGFVRAARQAVKLTTDARSEARGSLSPLRTTNPRTR